MHLLIPYVFLKNHPDPTLEEFTYGDGGRRARKLKLALKGDYIFPHTSNGNKKYITAYYVVDRVIDTVAAFQKQTIRAKYKNPHLLDCMAGKLSSNGYISELKKGSPNKVSGVIVCSGVMPAYENDIRKQKDIKILIYGWELRSQLW